MVDTNLLKQIETFFQGYRPKRNNILREDYQKRINDLAARGMFHSSIASDEISKLSADELDTRATKAWDSIKKLFERNDLRLSKNAADQVLEDIKTHIQIELNVISHIMTQLLANNKKNTFKTEVDRALAKTRNQIIPKIRAELNIYTGSVDVRKEIDFSILDLIAEDATKLTSGSNKDISDNIDKLGSFRNNVIKILHSKNQDWVLNTVLDVSLKAHAAAVAFFKSGPKGKATYESISSLIKYCFLKMNITLNNLDIYSRLLSFYYSEYTTLIMIPNHIESFYKKEYEECLEKYHHIDELESMIDQLAVAYRMLAITEKFNKGISAHSVTLMIHKIKNSTKTNKHLGNVNDKNHTVFICYAKEDKEHAEKLYESLRTRKSISVWWDKECLLPGVNWENEILNAIDKCDVSIVILSNNSVDKTGYVQKEIKVLLDRLSHFPPNKIFLIPARVDECSPQSRELKELHWVDMFDDWDAGFTKIVKTLEGIIEKK